MKPLRIFLLIAILIPGSLIASARPGSGYRIERLEPKNIDIQLQATMPIVHGVFRLYKLETKPTGGRSNDRSASVMQRSGQRNKSGESFSGIYILEYG